MEYVLMAMGGKNSNEMDEIRCLEDLSLSYSGSKHSGPTPT